MANVALIERNSEVWIAQEIDDNTLRRANPATFLTTGAGAAGTLVSASLVGIDVYSYIGNYVRVRTGAQAGLWREVTAYDGATTLTVEPVFSAPVGTGQTVEMWLPTGPTLRSRSAGAGANLIDADATTGEGNEYARDEAAEAWSDNAAAATIMGDRYFAHGRGGNNNDRAALITNDAAVAAGIEKTFTLEAGVFGAGAAGDYAVIRKAVWPADDAIITDWQLGRTIIERPTLRGAASLGEILPHVVGPPTGGTLPLVLELQPLQTPASGASLARGPAEAGDILRTVFEVSSDGASAAAAAVTPVAGVATALTVTSGQGDERFRVGNLVLIPATGEVGQIRDIADGGVGADTLTIAAGHLVATVPNAAVVQGGWNLRPIVSGFGSHMIERWPGGRRIVHCGWTPNVQIQGLAPDGRALLRFEGPFDIGIPFGDVLPTLTTPTGGRTPTATQVLPFLARGMRVILGGTLLEGAIEVNLDAGYQFGRRGSIAGAGNADGVQYQGRASKGTIKLHMDNWTQIDRWMQATELDLLVQVGGASGETFAFACPHIQLTDPAPTFEDGGAVQTLAFSVRRSTTSGTDAGAEVFVPDLVLGWF